MNRHERIFSILERVAADVSPVAQSRHAAAIVYKNEIVCLGVNSKKTHTFQKRFGYHEDATGRHAESDAIQRAISLRGQDFLTSASLYVLRMKYTDSSRTNMIRGMSRPCAGCMECINFYGINRIFYTTDDGDYAWVANR